MSKRSLYFPILGLVICLGLITATGAILPGESEALPTGPACPYNMDLILTYHCELPITEDTLIGAKLMRGCGSNEVQSWGVVSRFRGGSCAPCGDGVLPQGYGCS